MLRHYVLIKFLAETSAAHIEEFCHRMCALHPRIPGIEHLEVGRDILHDARSWDVVLIMRFASIDALRAYQQHPEHQQTMAFNAPAVAQVASVDFWAD
ncbi:MAG TPA: Dabb family protein [Steroidobacteraceae bacterium]|jgi:heme-degrading monooxygenase HmoA|nr:Dabb family protein [Steroidobacteraceae bacterium]